MLRSLITFALSRRPIVLLALLVFIIAGLIAYSKLNIEAYPNPAPVILEITAQAPGLSAEEMERSYTRAMEVGLATTPGVDNIRSTSFYGLSFVRVTFKYGVDYYFASTQAALNLQQNVSLPNGVQPQIQASSLVGEVLRYQLTGPPHTGLTNLRTLQDWVVTRRLMTVPGVMQVVTWGGTTKEYEVEADLHKLEGYGVTLPQLISAVGNANTNVGGRTVNIGQQSVNIRGVGLIKDTTDIGNIVLSQSNGVPVLVKDVAKVTIGAAPRLGKAGRDDQDDVVTGIVVMNRTLQTNEVLARIKTEVDKINADGSLPPGVKMEPFYDRSTLVNVTTHTVLHNLIFGCLLVFFIQWIFLGDLRSAIIVSANIPIALFFSIMILVMLGDSANLLSLGAVDFGIIVDSAVILVENIFRNFQKTQSEQQDLMEEQNFGLLQAWSFRLRLLYISAIQVDRAVLFSSAITVAAFIPLFTMQGVEGQIFSPMARTYAYALLGALFATFTVTPVLAFFLLPKHVEETETIVVRAIRRVYTPVLAWALAKRKTTVAIGLGFLLIAGLMLPRIGTEFLPALEEGNLWIRATMPTTASLEAGMDKVNRMRRILKAHPEVITAVSQHGRPDDGSDASGFYNVELFVPLKPFDEWRKGYTKDMLVKDVQDQFAAEFPGVEFNFSQYIQDNIEEGLSGVKGANSVKIIGPDLPTLEKLSGQVMHEMKQVKGVEDLGVFRVLGQPNFNITIDRAKAARYGLNTGDINAVVQAAAGGTQATTVLEGDRQFALTVRLAPQYRSDLDSISNIKVGYTTTGGATAYIPLRELATITLDTGASYIFHEKNERFIPVKFSVRGRDLGSTVEEAQARIAAKVALPNGYRIIWAGEFEELQQAKQRMEVVLPIALLAILVLLYTLFNSFRDSLLTLAAIPFSIAGGIVALYFSGLPLSVSAAIGFVSLFGVSVMNGILVISYFNHLIVEGKTPLEAMRNAAEQRMRPMLMTALSACIGLLPAALSTGIGSQVQRPLAIVVVGGMLLGPVMLLIVAPALQVMVLGWSRKQPEKKEA
ncbi:MULTISPECIES: efflux RND transporter permease subunit [unclassified Janthinobacterium]|uniref:efflux RND transporter permease subunit n=1 Tax=unclassified Janthinobacterium TaxID=2610881 RepID=UPI0016111462|nr:MULTISPECIES: CusA/CzcA family heavy metal efflux RND transporter [unclassified Janthinobacterium]MBB5368879.1 cobalt-zinc-cadmium resistance protein CzcA [Janthinobacterium sp. K2C7]MBB5381585.1 cobalt-zinc-cadmium resistance protein CzcA [Janthinobacterium sp. K2Li3]MBB5387261.1 cobalt-zinc-cadmium resistance protein CzcA [Janthinobacterium sp. K2E3]